MSEDCQFPVHKTISTSRQRPRFAIAKGEHMLSHSAARHNDLIFDVGVHKGQDTAYYLKKGFRVVGVEANPEICADLRKMFAGQISDGQFMLVEAAISTTSGPGKFYKFGTSVFGTISPDWAERNQGMGLDYDVIEVRFTTARELLSEYGVPYFIKIDIEGADNLCIEALEGFPKPKFLSIEAEKHDFDAFERQARLIASLGYRQFQLVQQQFVPFQRPPEPPREGRQVRHRFEFGSSGLFGADLPEDKWLGLDATLDRYRSVVRRHHFFGDYALGRRWLPRQLLRVAGLYPGWHDLHARLEEPQ
jgi:FkbM family methyltransferase